MPSARSPRCPCSRDARPCKPTGPTRIRVSPVVLMFVMIVSYRGFLMFAWAAARRAIGTLNGEQET